MTVGQHNNFVQDHLALSYQPDSPATQRMYFRAGIGISIVDLELFLSPMHVCSFSLRSVVGIGDRLRYEYRYVLFIVYIWKLSRVRSIEHFYFSRPLLQTEQPSSILMSQASGARA